MQVELSYKKKQVEVDELKIELTDIVTEEIAAAPGAEDSYPAGSGITVHLKLHEEESSQDVVLNQLSKPYESKPEVVWRDHKVTLLAAEPDQVKLEVT